MKWTEEERWENIFRNVREPLGPKMLRFWKNETSKKDVKHPGQVPMNLERKTSGKNKRVGLVSVTSKNKER